MAKKEKEPVQEERHPSDFKREKMTNYTDYGEIKKQREAIIGGKSE
jgi:hypothetical protein